MTTKADSKFSLAGVVAEDEMVHVEARPEATLPMLSTAASGEFVVNRPEAVLTNENDWLSFGSHGETFSEILSG